MKRTCFTGLVLLVAVNAWAATPAFVQSKSAQTAGTNNVTVGFTKPTDPANEGDHAIVVLVRWGDETGTFNVSDTAGNTYNLIAPPIRDGKEPNDGDTLLAWLALGVKSVPRNEVTVKITGVGDHHLVMAMIEYSHIAKSDAVDAVKTFANDEPIPAPVSVPLTTKTAGDVVVTALVNGPMPSPENGSFGQGWTDRENGGGKNGDGWSSVGRAFSADMVNVPAGTYTPSFTWRGGQPIKGTPGWGVQAITFALKAAK